MKKVLIISYFFPPCNLTAAQRIQGWADHLNKFGYYPTIVTRNWDISIKSPESMLKSSGENLIHKKNENFEVYYLPYKAGIRDRVFTRFSNSKLQFLSKPFTFLEIFLENFTTRFIPHRNLYTFSRKIILDQKFDKLIISGNPFDLFQFGYKLNKKFKTKWIADYRDDWTTTELKTTSKSIFGKIQRRSEKKWVDTASLFTSVSPYYVNKIEGVTSTPGRVLLNGFDNLLSSDYLVSNKTLTITYNGSLYSTQPIEVFLEACKNIIEQGVDLKINFIGTGYDKVQKERILNFVPLLNSHINITNRIARQEVLDIQKKSDILLMVPHQNLKGIPSSKLYEYLSIGKPILCCPNDKDIVEETLLDTGLGIICETPLEIEEKLLLFVDKKLKIEPNIEHISKYSREHQTKLLADYLNEL